MAGTQGLLGPATFFSFFCSIQKIRCAGMFMPEGHESEAEAAALFS